MQKEKILEARIKYKGWSSLFDNLEIGLSYLTQAVSIKEIGTRHGMLNVIFEETSDKHLTYFLNSLAFKLERDSVKICVSCGKSGIRRKNLNSSVYCFPCWVNASNQEESFSGE